MGYAEADPGFDVDGVDAAQKLALLAALAFDIPVSMDDMYIEGISGVTVEDLRYARELGFRIRHVGIARRNEEKFETRVHPSLIPATDLVGDVSGVANAVIVGANAIGSVLLVGPGAGGLPTASAVLSDLIEIARGTGQRLRTGQNEGIAQLLLGGDLVIGPGTLGGCHDQIQYQNMQAQRQLSRNTY